MSWYGNVARDSARAGTLVARLPKIERAHERAYAVLDESLDCRDAGNSAAASLMEFTRDDATSGHWDAGERTIRVWSEPGSQLGVILAGMVVQLAWSDGPGWVAVGGGKAKVIKVQPTATFAKTADTFEGHVLDWFDGENPDPDDAGLTIANGFASFAVWGNSLSTVFCRYQPDEDQYVAYQASCPEGYS